MIQSETLAERAERIESKLAAEEYRRKGYKITRRPKLDFFPSLRPDFVASKDGDNRVVEVKSRSSLLGNEKLIQLAEIVYDRPDWSLDLRLIGEPESLETPKSAKSFGVNEIVDKLSEAEAIYQHALPQPAFLIAWAACEAAIRHLMEINGVNNEKITATTHLFDQATYHGIVSRDDYFQLLDAAAYRNAFVHGFKVEEFDTELVSELIQATQNIVEAIGQGPIADENDDYGDFWPSNR